MITAIIQAVAGGVLAGQFIYHRWIEKPDRVDTPPREFQCPRSDEGAPIPLIFGRVRVRAPILVWGFITDMHEDTGKAGGFLLFVVGIGMNDGAGTSTIHAVYNGDDKMIPDGLGFISGGGDSGKLDLLYGGASQVVANDGDVAVVGGGLTAATRVAEAMIAYGAIPTAEIPGLRGYMSAFFYMVDGGNILAPYTFDPGNLQGYSFEASSYCDGSGYPAVGIYAQPGQDSNPVNVIWDVLKCKIGKLGLSTDLIDKPSLQACGTTLFNESHGYSRAFEDSAEAESKLNEILEEIDGVLDENPTTSKIRLKLIRDDYDPNTIFQVTRANCRRLENIASSGWDDLPNRVRVIFPDRENDYVESSVAASNQANAVGQDGRVREITIRYLGTCTEAQAQRLAERELAARSRPIMKLRAVLDRRGRDLMRGDPLRVTWDLPQIPGVVFRVADVERGTLGDDAVIVDLIQDHFYSYGGGSPRRPDFGSEIDEAISRV